MQRRKMQGITGSTEEVVGITRTNHDYAELLYMGIILTVNEAVSTDNFSAMVMPTTHIITWTTQTRMRTSCPIAVRRPWTISNLHAKVNAIK
jgi:hypothetical protein